MVLCVLCSHLFIYHSRVSFIELFVFLYCFAQTLPVMNLFELSRNFYNKGPDWLVEKYQKQHDSMC